MLLGHFVTGERAIDPANPAYSDEAVAKRLKPVGELLLAGEASQVEPRIIGSAWSDAGRSRGVANASGGVRRGENQDDLYSELRCLSR